MLSWLHLIRHTDVKASARVESQKVFTGHLVHVFREGAGCSVRVYWTLGIAP